MKINLFYNLKLRIDLSRLSSKNPLGDRLIKPLHKFAKLIIELIVKYKSSRPIMRQLIMLSMGIGGVKLLIKSCGTLTFIRPNTILC